MIEGHAGIVARMHISGCSDHGQTGILDDHTIADFEAGVLALLAGTRLKPIPVTPILSAQARAIGAHSTQVLLSSYPALKIWLKHTPTSFTPTFNAPVLFNLVPRIIFDGECRKIAPRRLIFLWSSSKDTTAPYKAVVKATQDGQLVFLESVYRIQFAQVRRAVATSFPVQSRATAIRHGLEKCGPDVGRVRILTANFPPPRTLSPPAGRGVPR